VYFQHGFFSVPSMHRTAGDEGVENARGVALPVIRHGSSYIANGSRSGNSAGVAMSDWQRSTAMEGPMLGMPSRRAIFRPPLAGFFRCWIVVGTDH
jgi:hypothetical protein